MVEKEVGNKGQLITLDLRWNRVGFFAVGYGSVKGEEEALRRFYEADCNAFDLFPCAIVV